MTDRLLKVQDVADYLGVSKDYAGKLMAKGEIAVTRIGDGKRSPVRVTEQALADFIAARTAPPRRSRRGAAA